MSLQPGVRLGPYEILAPLGAGGMGEVYRAHDPRLRRDIAVKVLPAALSADSERMARFEQEARAAAALNHPNILAVYDVGQHDGSPYIVSELLEGETLRERISGGVVPVRKAIDYAVQIARGLAAAHETGIVHRDLKPENVFVTRDGRVKILDFGLAKLTQADPAGGADTALPTSPPNTTPGMVLGTIGYMAPEQVRGFAADPRSDIFAFGAILYEMLSGVRAFHGDTVIDSMTAVLKDDPPDLPAARNIPPALARIVDRTLEKDPRARFQTVSDLGFALEALSSHSEYEQVSGVTAPWPRRQSRERLAWTLFATAVALLLGAGVLLYWERSRVDTRVYRMPIPPPLDTRLPPLGQGGGSPAGNFAISPDGRRLVFAAIGPDNQRRQLWIRSLDVLTAQPLAGSDGARGPFWSPDSRFIAFFAQGKLKKVDSLSGALSTVCDVPTPEDAPGAGAGGGTWSDEGIILFSGTSNVIFRVSASGGVPVAVTTLNKERAETWHNWPFFLPDGRHFLHLALGTASGVNQANGVYIASLDSAERTLLIPGGSNAMYAQGHVLFMSDATLMAQPFDATRLRLSGEAVPVVEDVALGGSSGRNGAFSVSTTGVLAYQEGAGPLQTELVWFDRQGSRIGTLGDRREYGEFALSPDDTYAAVSILDQVRNTRNLWIYDVARSGRSRFTTGPANDSWPVWSPDGRTIVFSSNRVKNADLYQKIASGIEDERLILQTGHGERPWSWSPDGKYVLYSGDDAPPANLDLWVLPLFGDRKPFPFLATPFVETRAEFSPDGRWVAYTTSESSAGPEIRLAPFPKADNRYRISTNGGSWPRWGSDGKDLFYVANSTLMRVEVNTQGATPAVGAATPLFRIDPRRGEGSPYDVSHDGQRFLVNTRVERLEPPPITIVVNWTAGLNK